MYTAQVRACSCPDQRCHGALHAVYTIMKQTLGHFAALLLPQQLHQWRLLRIVVDVCGKLCSMLHVTAGATPCIYHDAI